MKNKTHFISPDLVPATPNDFIDITGLPKDALLAALYNQALHTGFQALHTHKHPSMTEAQAKNIIQEQGLTFYFLDGRPFYISLEADAFNPKAYDAQNGQGTAHEVVRKVREQHLATMPPPAEPESPKSSISLNWLLHRLIH